MTATRVVLLDAYNTVLTVNSDAALKDLLVASGLTRAEWLVGTRAQERDIMTGAVSPEEAFATTFRLAGKPLPDLERLVTLDLELLERHTSVYPDVLPVLEELRARGLGVGIVSNCAPNTSDLLDHLGLARLVDHLVLSCEVGSVKPECSIYRAALDAFTVEPSEVLFVDDQVSYCSAAEGLGMTAVRIDRRSPTSGAIRSLFRTFSACCRTQAIRWFGADCPGITWLPHADRKWSAPIAVTDPGDAVHFCRRDTTWGPDRALRVHLGGNSAHRL